MHIHITNYSYSDGWLANFKQRYSLSKQEKHGESGSVDFNTIKVGRNQIKNITKEFKLSDIYNMDETALYYKLQPGHTIADRKVMGSKLSKERITIAFCVNADGSHKLKPIIINKAARPRSFGKLFNPNTISYYYSNNKAWMNMIIFKDWLFKFNEIVKNSNRKVLLLVDNAGGHNISTETKIKCTNIRIEYLLANTTSVLQPLDGGIIRAFKAHYRSLLVNFLVEQLDSDKDELRMPELKQSMYIIKRAWSNITEKTIINWLS